MSPAVREHPSGGSVKRLAALQADVVVDPDPMKTFEAAVGRAVQVGAPLDSVEATPLVGGEAVEAVPLGGHGFESGDDLAAAGFARPRFDAPLLFLD